jgi:GDSL-like Lipase/Acylhydrolase family
MTPPRTRTLLRSLVAIIVCIGAEAAMRHRPRADLPTLPHTVVESGIACVGSAETLWEIVSPTATESSEEGLEILVCGEDDACGVFAGENESWPAVLQTVLRRALGTAELRIRVAGAPGFTALQGERTLERELAASSPQIVLLHFGSANEFAAPIDNRSDEAWLANRREDTLLGSVALAAIRSAIDYGPIDSRTTTVSARVDVTTFERALERMIRSVRAANACPVVVSPIPRPGDLSTSRDSAIGALYRAAARRVASVYGVPFVALDDAFPFDRNPLRATSRHLSHRGAKVVAQECFRVLARDSAILLAIQHWLERNTSDASSTLVAGSFGLLHTIYREGPSARVPDTAIDLLGRSFESGPDSVRLAACARLAIARAGGDDLAPLLSWLDGAANAAPEEDPLVELLRGVLRIFSGASDEGRAILTTAPLENEPLARLFAGVSYLSTDRERAEAEFARAIELDPALGLTELWRAKAAQLANEDWSTELSARLAKVAIECHGAGPRSIVVPVTDRDSIESFLLSDPALFGIHQRIALPRLVLAFWLEAPTRRAGIEIHLDRALEMQNGGRDDLARLDLEAARALGATVNPDALLRAAEFALHSGFRDHARDFATAALERLDSPEAAFTMGIIELDSGSPALAVSLFERACAVRTRDAKYLFYLARARLAAGDAAGAADAARSAYQLWPDDQVRDLLERAEAESPPP